MFNVIEEKYPINKYIFGGDISLPSGFMFIAPVYSEGNLDYLRKDLITNVRGIGIDDLIITQVVVGRLCYRLFDNMYSMQYKPLVEKYKVRTYQGRITYDKEAFEREEELTIDINKTTSKGDE
jgi:hypothetical protein